MRKRAWTLANGNKSLSKTREKFANPFKMIFLRDPIKFEYTYGFRSGTILHGNYEIAPCNYKLEILEKLEDKDRMIEGGY